MRQAFTLIELMIVIAIIAIIAAIAIPNLLESRISSNEAAAATSLKSGLFPAQVTFQSGTYVDMGSPSALNTANGIGDYSTNIEYMAGTFDGTPNNAIPDVALSLLGPTWKMADGIVNNSSYVYDCDSSVETSYCISAWPNDTAGGSVGRRRFAINATGIVVATAPSITNTAASATPATPFGATFNSSAVTGWTTYKR